LTSRLQIGADLAEKLIVAVEAKLRLNAKKAFGHPKALTRMVERRRFELLTSSMPLKRATNCANAPRAVFIPYLAYR
jgi:hypothetical protein